MKKKKSVFNFSCLFISLCICVTLLSGCGAEKDVLEKASSDDGLKEVKKNESKDIQKNSKKNNVSTNSITQTKVKIQD